MSLVRRARFWGFAFVFSYAVWLLHDDSAKLPELLAGVVVAAIAATGTELVRGQRVAPMSFRLAWVWRAWRLVPSAARDCVALTAAAVAQLIHPQPTRGVTVEMPFRHGGDDPLDHGRRAVGQGLGSFAPATVVIGVDPDREVVIAHQLAASGSASDLDPLGIG